MSLLLTTVLALLTAATCCAAGGDWSRQCGIAARLHPWAMRFHSHTGKIASLFGNHWHDRDHRAEPHSHPWTAYLSDSGGEKVLCGGALISPQWLLTAAHCFGTSAPSTVVLGAPGGYSTVQTAGIGEVVKHPQYDSKSGSRDFALVRLATVATLSDEIKPVCLPAASDDFTHTSDKMLAIGWASGKEDKDVREYVVRRTDCDAGSAGGGTLCALSEDYKARGACMSGGGYPLVTSRSPLPGAVTAFGAQMLLVGVMGGGDKCLTDNNEYGHVPAVRQWIEQVAGV